jgi:putative ABC transport system permease protein
LVQAQNDYYRDTRFADIWVALKRAPNSLGNRIETISGVQSADTRITFLATLDLEGLDAPAQGRFVSIPLRGRPSVNDIVIRKGRYPAPKSVNEIVISDKFSEASGLAPGDTLRAVINGRLRELDIVGTGISAEHSYAVPPGALYPEDERYGIVWAGQDWLAPAYDMDGAFNEVVVTLSRGANAAAVMDELDQLLGDYGGLGAYSRDRQVSHQILHEELNQIRVTGTAIPAIFLGVAAFLLNLVLGRLIDTQRMEIAVLKAYGYRDREIGWHYLSFALVAFHLRWLQWRWAPSWGRCLVAGWAACMLNFTRFTSSYPTSGFG